MPQNGGVRRLFLETPFVPALVGVREHATAFRDSDAEHLALVPAWLFHARPSSSEFLQSGLRVHLPDTHLKPPGGVSVPTTRSTALASSLVTWIQLSAAAAFFAATPAHACCSARRCLSQNSWPHAAQVPATCRRAAEQPEAAHVAAIRRPRFALSSVQRHELQHLVRGKKNPRTVGKGAEREQKRKGADQSGEEEGEGERETEGEGKGGRQKERERKREREKEKEKGKGERERKRRGKEKARRTERGR